MAYHSIHERSPFIDAQLQAVLERRGVELLGIALIGLSVLIGMMVWSYSPEDPSWLSATDAPIQNMLGVTGASIAAPVMLVLGWSSWTFAALSAAWGLRCLIHLGAERALWRLVFAPFAIALMALYCASLIPPAIWTHSFGMGGLFGDTILKQVLLLMPFTDRINVLLTSLVTGISFVAMLLFCLGFTRHELGRVVRFLFVGVVMTYALLMNVLGRGTSRVFRAASSFNAAAPYDIDAETGADRAAGGPVMKRTQPPMMAAKAGLSLPPAPAYDEEGETSDAKDQEPAQKPSLFSLMPSFAKRPEKMPEPELVEDYAQIDDPDMPGDERIKAKINHVIKSRVRRGPELIATAASHTGPKTFDPADEGGDADRSSLRVEPPMTARQTEEDFLIEDPFIEPEQQGLDILDEAVPEDFDAETLTYAPRSLGGVPKYEPKKVVQPPVRKPIMQSSQAKKEAQPSLQFDDSRIEYELPPLSLLANPVVIERQYLSDESLEENARLLESVLDDYGVRGEIVSVRPGPVVTMYELEPAPGLKASRVIGLSDDIARSMSALSARVSTIPGKTVIGIELPNENREKVVLREILASKFFGDGNQKLPIALGKDISGEPVVANLAKMPHLLIAGTTGSGKSVAINTMILSLLYKLTPDECRLIMIDPKMLELSVYDGIPHLLSPVVTDPKKAVVALKWVVGEMEERYRKMSKMGVRNIDGYNGRVEDTLAKGEMFSRTVQTGFDDDTGEPVFETEEFAPEKMPYIVVIVDEMADLMMVAGKEIEACIQRLAQMARASGIHLIMATQRPSVDVITGTIKANFPTRISFQVTSKIDSRTILGEMGAEQLLGMGDMLYMAGGSKISRCHGPFVSDEEVEEVVNHLKAYGPPEYKSGVVDGPEDDTADSIDLVLGLGGNTDGEDALYDQAVAIVIKDRKCSTSYIQRKLAIGYNKAARLVEQMEDEGLVSPANHVGKREILVPEQQ